MKLHFVPLLLSLALTAGAAALKSAHKGRMLEHRSTTYAMRPCKVPSRAKKLSMMWATKCGDDRSSSSGRALSEDIGTVEEIDIPAVLIDERSGLTLDCEILQTVAINDKVYASMSPRDTPATISRYEDGELIELGEEEDDMILLEAVLPMAIEACDKLGMSLIHSAVALTLAGDLDSVPYPENSEVGPLENGRDPMRGDRISIDGVDSEDEPDEGEGQAEIFAEFAHKGQKFFVILLDPIFVVGKQRGKGSVEFVIPSEEEMEECIIPLEELMLEELDQLYPQDAHDDLCDDKGGDRRARRARRALAPAAAVPAEWGQEWTRRFDCWWMALPGPTQSQLGACLGALSLHLGSRLDGVLGRSPPQTAARQSEQGCEWIGDAAPQLRELPDFPDPIQFNLPPIPRLLPQLVPSYVHIQSLSTPGALIYASQPAQSQAAASSSTSSRALSAMLLSAVGGGIAGAALVLFVGTRARRASKQ